jgi:hypothetical protein
MADGSLHRVLVRRCREEEERWGILSLVCDRDGGNLEF